LRKLRAPRHDIASWPRFSRLRHRWIRSRPPGQREIGNTRKHIEKLFSKAEPEDLILLFFSGHGIKGVDGRLYLASTDTEHDVLASTTYRRSSSAISSTAAAPGR